MPTENRSTIPSIPPFIGETPLGGSYYAVECTRCGWVGSSEELTDDCQCMQPDGEHVCLGHTDEIGPERLLGIVQAMAKQARHQGEPVVLPMPKLVSEYNSHDWDEGYRDGWGACRNEIARLGPLYTHADSGEVERLRAELDQMREERDGLHHKLAERDALLSRVVDHAKFWREHPYAEVVEGIAKDYNALSANADLVENDDRQFGSMTARFACEAIGALCKS